MNGHKSRTKVLFVLSAVAIASTFLVAITLSPIAITAILITAIATLVFVPRFILSSTDHCKIALIVSKHRQKERTLKFQSLSFFLYFLIGVDIKMEKSKDNRFVIVKNVNHAFFYILSKFVKYKFYKLCIHCFQFIKIFITHYCKFI